VAYTDDKQVWPLVVDLASCVCAELDKASLPATCFCGVIPGDVSYDYCGNDCAEGVCGGMAWVSPKLLIPSQQLATSQGIGVASRRCQFPDLTLAVEVGIVRCAPMPDGDGSPPSLADYLDAAQLQLADMAALERALLCCQKDPPVLDAWNSVGPDGGCLGGVWTAAFPLEF
jgi:hypothetical protein